jgi:hypothetical protein
MILTAIMLACHMQIFRSARQNTSRHTPFPTRSLAAKAQRYFVVRKRTAFYFVVDRVRTSPQFGNPFIPGGLVSCLSPVPSALIKKS